MPRRETRESIERTLDEASRKRKLMAFVKRRRLAGLDLHLARLREVLDPVSFAKVQSQFLQGTHRVIVAIQRKRRPRGDGSMPALVEPPRGPKPFTGGAAAALEFD